MRISRRYAKMKQHIKESEEESMKRKILPLICGILLLSAIPVHAYEYETKQIIWDEDWEYASYSEIHGDDVTLYQVSEDAKTVSVNAGHGTVGGTEYSTLCHPDGTPKVTGGSTAEGAVYATAIAVGTTMLDGTAEAEVTLSLAEIVRDQLLEAGYNVLMIRENMDTQLDNIARTVFSNQNADCHIALHYDSTEYDKGLYYMSVPMVDSYLSMEPVASHWEEHTKLGESLIAGCEENGIAIFEGGSLAMDLTQTSYSTVPSVDVEVGDRGSDYSRETQEKIAAGLVKGIEKFFES